MIEISFPPFVEEKELQRLIVAKKKDESKRRQLKIDVQQLTKHPKDILKDCVERMKVYCEQGGFGYAFNYKLLDGTRPPHHWVIKPECIDKCVLTKEELIAIRYCKLFPDFWFSIAKSPQTELWGN